MGNDQLIEFLRDMETVHRNGDYRQLDPKVTAEAFRLAVVALEEQHRPAARTSDPTTSQRAAESVRLRAGSQRSRLLAVYLDSDGLTDEEAGAAAGLANAGYWKRCSELRNCGFIEPLGFTRLSSAGERQQVCGLTEAGKVLVESGTVVASR